MSVIKSVQEVARDRLDEYSQAVSSEFFPSVRPIYRTGRGPREQIATCTLLDIRQEKYLVTAAHVIDERQTSPLYVGGQSETAEIEYEEFVITNKPADDRRNDPYDFFIAKLSPEFAATLRNVGYIRKEQLADDRTVPLHRNYLALGYPCSKNRKVDVIRKSVRPTTWKYSAFMKEDPELAKIMGVPGEDHFFLNYDAKRSRNAEGEIVNSVDAHGLSGGPLIDMGYIGKPGNLRREEKCYGRLAGLLIEVRAAQKAIVAVKIGRILREVGVEI
jgi:hypothetical protein